MLDGIDYRAKVVTMTKIIQFSMTQAAGYSDTCLLYTSILPVYAQKER